MFVLVEKNLQVRLGSWKENVPGVSITLRIWPSFNAVVRSSQVRVTPDDLASETNAFFCKILFPVALFPLPVHPTKTRVLGSPEGEASYLEQEI